MVNLLIILIIITLATFSGWGLWAYLSQAVGIKNNANSYISQQLKYQFSFLVIAILIAWLSYKLSGHFFGIGNLNAEINTYGYIPKFQSITWLSVAFLLVLSFLVSTYYMVAESFSNVGSWRLFLKKYGVWVFILASINSLSEELIYRGALITIMDGNFPHWFIAIMSGIVFLLAHIKGQVKGLLVLFGSGFVGWCLAYVVLQTQGLFWAWFIHFVQDIVIFSAFIMSATKSENNKS